MPRRIQKQISLVTEDQGLRLQQRAIAVGKEAKTDYQRSLILNKQRIAAEQELSVSRMNQLIADGDLMVVWAAQSDRDRYEPILEMVNQKQSFKVTYKDAGDKAWGYTVLYAQVIWRTYKLGKVRAYIDCWCDEGAESGNQEIPQLSHNWSLRINSDHYTGSLIEPINAEWRSEGLDYVDVTMEFSGGLAWGYEGDDNDIEDSGSGKTRMVTRRITSSYWFLREMAPHIICHPGSIKILSPEEIRKNLDIFPTLGNF